jgi:hypothetical protein
VKYRRKPVEVNATQWFPGKPVTGVCFCAPGNIPHVHTAHQEQVVLLQPGDWIIPEADSIHYYPVKPDDFERLYEPVDDSEQAQ